MKNFIINIRIINFLKIECIFISLICALLVGCQNRDVKERYHPDPALLPPREAFDHIFYIDQMRSEDSLELVISRLQAMQPRWQIGALVGRKEEMFGEIKDVSRDSRGRIFVLDRKNAEVRVFNSAGAYLFSVGARGEGPGEWIYPEWIALDEEDTLFVADRQMKIDVFVPEGTRYVYHRTISSLPIVPSGGLCVGDSILIVSGHRARANTPFIYKINKSGQIMDTLGIIKYKSDNRLVWNYITKNYMICDLDQKIIVVVFRYIPIVQVYHIDTGHLIWEARIEGVNISGFTEKDGAIYFYEESNKMILIPKILNINGGAFMFQYVLRKKGNFNIYVFMFDIKGRYFVSNSDYPILWIDDKSKIVININHEYPNIYYFEKI